MRRTLRRSCAACAKAKHSCDLQTPKCSRCVKRNCSCFYANEPLNSTSPRCINTGDRFQASLSTKSLPLTDLGRRKRSRENVSQDLSDISMFFEAHLLDPFDSYPSTSLPRLRVQGLMQHCECHFIPRSLDRLADLPQFCRRLHLNTIP